MMAGNSTRTGPGFWSWVRAALAFQPIDNRLLLLRDGDLPPIFRINDSQAVAAQGDFLRSKRLQLTVLLLATAMAVLAERFDSRYQAAIAALLYGLTVLFGLRTARLRAKAANAHRVAAETVKSMAWLYMAHGGPFHSGVADPDTLFHENLEESLRDLRKLGLAPDFTRPTVHDSQVTPAMRAVRAKPFAVRREIYLRDRLLDQLIWYREKSTRMHRAAVRWSEVTSGLTLLALLATVFQAIGLISGWSLAVLLSAAVAAAMTWQEAQRYGPLAYVNALIEQDLETVRIVMATRVTEEGWASAVAEVERLMSPQYAAHLMHIGT